MQHSKFYTMDFTSILYLFKISIYFSFSYLFVSPPHDKMGTLVLREERDR